MALSSVISLGLIPLSAFSAASTKGMAAFKSLSAASFSTEMFSFYVITPAFVASHSIVFFSAASFSMVRVAISLLVSSEATLSF